MLDDIGLGKAIANTVYVVIILTGFFGAWFFQKKKLISGLIFWVSFVLNIFFYLFLMGNYRLYPKIIFPIVNKYWPLLNIALLFILIIGIVKNKYAKKESI